MAPTPLDPTTRHIPTGVSRYYWVPVIASAALAATRIEIDAGTDLTSEIAAITGFSVTGATVDTPDAASRFVSRVNGLINPADSSISFYASKTGEDAATFFSRDMTGYLMFLDGGDVATQPAEVFPVSVTSVSRGRELTAARLIMVSYAITAEPQVVDIPALT